MSLAHPTQIALASEIVAKRTRRHLDDLERSNQSEPIVSLGGLTFDDDGDGGGGEGGRKDGQGTP